MKIAYFDCFAGCGGDMIVAAMIDAGLDADFLQSSLDSLGIADLKIKVEKVMRCGISALHFTPAAPGEQHHRKLSDIIAIIQHSDIGESAKGHAAEIFRKLAEVEGRIHAKDVEAIHFHEVGAVDSIVDIVSACVGFDALGVEEVCCSALSVGGGTVQSAHGLLPVPAPATVELLKQAGAPIVGGPVDSELLTPTAAAILTHFAGRFGAMGAMTVQATGYGAGTRQFDNLPNILRLVVGQTEEPGAVADCVCVLECNIDDADGETVGFAMDRLLDAGALDVFTTAIGMKHNRPAVMLSVISPPAKAGDLERIIFSEGLTLGIRRQLIARSKLARQSVTVRTEFGEVRIKIGSLQGRLVSAKPEYADCAEAAQKHGIPLKQVRKAAMEAFRESTV
jgi:uncharacterized protein (TIGR00299 family) protein